MSLGWVNYHNEEGMIEPFNGRLLNGYNEYKREVINVTWESFTNAWLFLINIRRSKLEIIYCLWVLWVPRLGFGKRDWLKKAWTKPF